MIPFIGLFGTIWGVMKCFDNFSGVEFLNFASISSGVSEALFLSGLGLFVAILSLIIYNILLYKICLFIKV